jgi:prolyl-tRNA synthetase
MPVEKFSSRYEPSGYVQSQEIDKNGWACSWWYKNPDCGTKIQEDTEATPGCTPFDQPGGSGTCNYCSQPATEKVYFARAH